MCNFQALPEPIIRQIVSQHALVYLTKGSPTTIFCGSVEEFQDYNQWKEQLPEELSSGLTLYMEIPHVL